MKKALVSVPERCQACLTCVVECAFNKSDAPDDAAPTAEILAEARLDVETVRDLPVPVVCQHCEDAPCKTACPTGAIFREDPDGPVLLRQDKCIGCKACVMACPFGMAWMNYTGAVAQKCDRCIARAEEGKLPACVTNCPVGAIIMRPVDDIVRDARKRHAEALVAAKL